MAAVCAAAADVNSQLITYLLKFPTLVNCLSFVGAVVKAKDTVAIRMMAKMNFLIVLIVQIARCPPVKIFKLLSCNIQ